MVCAVYQEVEIGRECSRHGMGGKCTFLLKTSEAMRPPGRPRLRWVDGIKMELTGYEVMCWVYVSEY
jgi:hypothetical protein